MTVKKIALLGLASVATLGMSISMAGGPAACAPEAQLSGFYVGADVGAFSNYAYQLDANFVDATRTHKHGHTYITAITAGTSSTKNVPWGLTASGLVGYQFDNSWGLQFGYIWEQKQKLSFTGTSTRYDSAGVATSYSSRKHRFELNMYSLYLAGRFSVPLWNGFGAYTLVGPAWTHLKEKVTHVNQSISWTEKDSYWSPMGAIGVAWHVDDGFSLNLQYTYIMSNLTGTNAYDISNQVGATQRVTVGAGYLFAM